MQRHVFISICFIVSVNIASAQNWQVFNTSNSHSPFETYSNIAIDTANGKWLIKPSGFGAKTIYFDNDTTWISRDNIIGSNVFGCRDIYVDKRNVVWERTDNYRIVSLTGGINGSFYLHDAAATGLPAMDGVFDMAIDKNGAKWFACYNGIVKYNDTAFTMMDTISSDLPFAPVNDIAIDKNNHIFITGNSNMAKFDGNSWQVFSLPSMYVDEMETDSSGNLWLGLGGFGGGLYKFDGSSWTNYTTSNSDLPSNNVYTIAIDRQNNFWTTYSGGFVRFDGTAWTRYDASAGYPGTGGGRIITDRYNNKWNTSGVGVIVFNETGIVAVNDIEQEQSFNLYPNPASDHLVLQLVDVASASRVTITNTLGQTLQTFQFSKGAQQLQLNVSDLPLGIYFIQLQTTEGMLSKKFIKE